MYIYRFEIIHEKGTTPTVIVAETDEQAFNLVDVELEKYFLTLPDYQEIVLFEKKRIGKGGGFVLPAFTN
ncbi:hypothetical protein JOC78_002796 [Bacillus ectoiniformans]|uniref:DUF3906 family protein n=1 Tax=Bacillus ectoiniformans TaxID=1494429 RepID=UPI00195979F5|nr:DUF3906 family protein [Bacillus ectoiniformans]MBM7649812.1 hypothetical protein [Bacillus ectoiniformans]